MAARVIETWRHKGFWLGTEHTGICAQIALENANQKWKATKGDETIAFVSKDWGFNQQESTKFIEMYQSGKFIKHQIDFSEWNEVAQKWRQDRKKK